MEENHSKTFTFFLKLELLLQLVYSINHQCGAEAAQPDLRDRMSKIEAQNRRHELEISILKTEKVEDKKEISKLRERVALLEDSNFSNASSGDKLLRRSGRPARLLPLQVLRPKRKNETEEGTKRFYGPPTSCDELNQLGYTLNGYYLIKGNKEKLNVNRIQVVYCQFRQLTGVDKKKNFETWIGNVEVKTKNVHFYVQRNSSFHGSETLTYNVEQLNVGGAMNLATGYFTAPVSGIYHFEFRCLKDEIPFESEYFLQVRQSKPPTVVSEYGPQQGGFEIVTTAYIVNLSYIGLPGSLTASLKLRVSDVVRLFSKKWSYLYDSGSHHTQFAGWLVEEDLMLL